MNKKQSHQPVLGAHTSIAGGFLQAIARCEKIGGNGAQIFVKNNHQWFAAALQAQEAKEFVRQKRAKNLFFCGHSGYLINLGSKNPELLEKSLRSLEEELWRTQVLEIPFLVLHPGSHGGDGEEQGLQRIAEALNEVIARTRECSVKLALETTAGQGTSLGHKFEHLRWLLEHVDVPDRFGVCVDTAHLFEAGYDLRTADAFKAAWKEFDRVIGYDKLLLIHCNDSKTPLGSRVDRHEHLGKGKIGIEAFRLLMEDKKLEHVPKILETPKSADLSEDVENLKILRSFLK